MARTSLPDGRPVLILEQLAEQDELAALPATLDALVTQVQQMLQSGLQSPGVPITTRGKFVEPLFLLDEA